MSPLTRFRPLLVLAAVVLMLSQLVGASGSARTSVSRPAAAQIAAQQAKVAPRLPGITSKEEPGEGEGEIEEDPYARDDAFYSRRTAGDHPITVDQAAVLREQAAKDLLALRSGPTPQGVAPAAFAGAWSALGPNPIVAVARLGGIYSGYSGRVSALAVRSTNPYTMYLGGAQGGVWISSTLTTAWQPVGNDFTSLAIGAIALAPSNENTVYVGTGEGSTSGDSYYGVGIYKSTNAGRTFAAIADNTPFQRVSISKIVVDPQNPDHLWVATIRGRGGARRTTPPVSNPNGYGIWFSANGGDSWTQQVAKTGTTGGTDLVIDPQTTGNSSVLLASFWTEGISKTVDGGQTWTTAMSGLPANANYKGNSSASRFALGISHPSPSGQATVYTGFGYNDTNGVYHQSTVWKSTNAGGTWTQTNTNIVKGYCDQGPTSTTSQCSYDNVIEVDPNNANIVYALGLWNYSANEEGNADVSGGIFRSTDGGATWRDLGYPTHPDFHAIAIRKDAPQNIIIGNDGGVWASKNRGGRPSATDPITATDWIDLNGNVDPDTSAVLGRTGLQIAQFTSVQQHPTNPLRMYGGTQDNGTLLRSTSATNQGTWFDKTSGDGGQTAVDYEDPSYVYGMYPFADVYRFTDGMLGPFFSNESILNGIDPNDASDFYGPLIIDPANPNRLYLPTDRVYRTDNARAPEAGDVLWKPISPNLTSGCGFNPAPNGARNCSISAIAANAGSPAVWVGTLEGWVWLSKDATVDSPQWTRVDTNTNILPLRPVGAIAIDRSNYQVAYVGYNGFDAATPGKPGHVFKTTNGGQNWTNITGNLPDNPVNSLVIDPADANTIYAGTDVGPMVTTNGGGSWQPLGSNFPIVNIWQLDLNPFTRQIAIATHGIGAWRLTDSTPRPALEVRKSHNGKPVGPNQNLVYTISVKNTGNLTATGVIITDPLPANTTFVSASNGGAFSAGNVTWSGLTVPRATVNANGGRDPGVLNVTLTVKTAGSLTTGQKITNKDFTVTATGISTIKGSPYEVTIAPPFGLSLVPPSQTGYGRPRQSVDYTLTVTNLGFNNDSYNLTKSSSAWTTTLWDAGFTKQITRIASLAPGDTATVGVRVSIPANATHTMSDTITVTATSVGNPSVKASSKITTVAITRRILLVDDDAFATTVVQVESYYKAALDANAYTYDYWDLEDDQDLPLSYMRAHDVIVWFTGASYPAPVVPYEDRLAAFLDGGGRLFMSGWDILDQEAGETNFVHDYLHIDWDDDRDNDITTTSVTAVPTNTLTAGLGTLPLTPVLGPCACNDQIVPIAPAKPAFRDQNGKPNALTVEQGPYKVVFLAFPFEELGTANNRKELMKRSIAYLLRWDQLLPIIRRTAP